MNNLLDLLKELKINTLAFILFMFVLIICPGSLIVFLYENEIFNNLDIIKLIILSISIGSPIFIFNYFINHIIVEYDLSFIESRFQWELGNEELSANMKEANLETSIGSSFLALYGGILIAYIFDFSIMYLIYSIIVLNCVIIVLFYFREKNAAEDFEKYYKKIKQR